MIDRPPCPYLPLFSYKGIKPFYSQHTQHQRSRNIFLQMGSLGGFFLLILLSMSHVFVLGDVNMIKKTCKSTNYYDTCMTALKSNSSSTKADTRGLAIIMIEIGMVNANGTSSYLSSQLLTSTNDVLMKKVVKECADKYSYAYQALQSSLQEMDTMSFDYATMQLTAANDYPNSCHNAYRRFPGLAYPVELARREDALERICDVATAIISLLNWHKERLPWQ